MIVSDFVGCIELSYGMRYFLLQVGGEYQCLNSFSYSNLICFLKYLRYDHLSSAPRPRYGDVRDSVYIALKFDYFRPR